jgi:hypothetical protein
VDNLTGVIVEGYPYQDETRYAVKMDESGQVVTPVPEGFLDDLSLPE